VKEINDSFMRSRPGDARYTTTINSEDLVVLGLRALDPENEGTGIFQNVDIT